MLEPFQDHIDRFRLCEKKDRILLAISGGLDSTAMLYLFREAGFNVAVAHCNFQLRGKESDGDEAFVIQLCKSLGIHFFIKRFETEAYAWENTLSTQMAARELRYAWFDELLNEHDFQYLATGHHFDDSMETILLNITRGSATEGLAGIPLKNGKIIRPLLFATRKQVEIYAGKRGLVWREDGSNLTDDYQRNFIRHQVIPKLKEINPSLETTWQGGIEKIKGDLALIQHAFEEWKRMFVTEMPERTSILKTAFQEYHHGAPLLWRFVKQYGFNFEQCKETLQSLHGQPGKRFLSHTHLLVVDRDAIVITSRQQHWNETIIDGEQTESFLGPWSLMIERKDVDVKTSDDAGAVLDAAQLNFPITWRKWKSGDYFYPLGMAHKKKLSDFFIDIKLSVADKDSVTVLESEGKIIWIPGYRVDDRYKITPQTTSRVSFTIKRATKG